jgi:hypothetical protein
MQETPQDRHEFQTIGSTAVDPSPDRCVCSDCGAHVACRVGLATVSGCCSVCGSTSVKPVGHADRRSPRFR